MNNRLSFDSGVSRHRPIRSNPDRTKLSPLRENVIQGDGKAPHFPMIPLRNLDVKFQDRTTEQWVVIPKGRVCSAITVANHVTGQPLRLDLPEESGDLPTGTNSAIDQTPLVVNSDGSYYGYSRSVAGLIVPSNGGFDRTITYDLDDVRAYVPDMNGGGAVSDGGTYVLPANAPIGVSMYDVYQDIRGQFLNYELWTNYAVQAWGYMYLPFVDYGILNSEFGVSSFVDAADVKSGYKLGAGAGALDPTADGGYRSVEAYHSFVYFDSEAANMAGMSGQLLRSDAFGNYIPQGAKALDADVDITLDSPRTAQTVGRIVGIDTRHPKDLLELVDGFDSDHRVTGTKTEGIPERLYQFARKLIQGSGYAINDGRDEAKHIKEMVQAGALGFAKVQLSIK